MRKIAIALVFLFFLTTLGMASAVPTMNVTIRELCRVDDTIAYGVYDARDNALIDTIEAEGYLDLLDQIEIYEKAKGVNLIWNYANKGGIGTYNTQC